MGDISRYVVLKFNSAHLFRKDGLKAQETFKEPVTKFQVANLLNALTNQKLVTTKRESIFEHKLMDWAEECLIKIDDQAKIEYPMKSGVFRPHMHYMQTDKHTTNANHPSTRVEWYDLLNEFNIEGKTSMFGEMMEFLNQKWGITTDLSFNEAMVIIYSTNDWILFDEMIVNNVKTFKGWLCVISGIVNTHFEKEVIKTGEIYLGHEVKYRRTVGNASSEVKRLRNFYTSHIVHKGVGMAERYDGTILVPIRELNNEEFNETEDYKLLSNGPGVATLLDDGSVYIDSVVRTRTVNIIDFVKVKDVSLEMVKYNNFK